jgi:hypothetical protein
MRNVRGQYAQAGPVTPLPYKSEVVSGVTVSQAATFRGKLKFLPGQAKLKV